MIITTTNNVENYSIKCYLGIVNANIVIGANLFSDFAASLTDIFGGRSGTYQNKLELIYKEVMREIKKKADKIKADAILGLQIDFDEVSGGGKSMFMVSASGTAVLLEKNFEDRYAMYRTLNEIYDYWSKGFLSEEEYNYERNRILDNYNSHITREVKAIKETKEQKQIQQKTLENKIEEINNILECKADCTDVCIPNISIHEIQTSSYDDIHYNTEDSMQTIISKFIRLNRIHEACKYYMDETGLQESDAIDYVVDTFRNIELRDKNNLFD